MKKILSAILVISALISLCACGNTAVTDSDETKQASDSALKFEFSDCDADDDETYIDLLMIVNVSNSSDETVYIQTKDFICKMDGENYYGVEESYSEDVKPGSGESNNVYVNFEIPYMGEVDLYYKDTFISTVKTSDYDINADMYGSDSEQESDPSLDFEFCDCYTDDDEDYIDFGVEINVYNNTDEALELDRSSFNCVLDGNKYYAEDESHETLDAGEEIEESYSHFELPYIGTVDFYYGDTFIKTINMSDYE